MGDLNSTNLCRICLREGATVPIFENSCTEDDVYNKLILCLHCEKIEDIEGFPRHICLPCNTTLVTLCNFINKYKESSKILKDGFKIVKKEINGTDNVDINEITGTEIELEGIKLESDDYYQDDFDDIEDEKPLNILKNKGEPVKKLVRTHKTKSKITKPESRTSKITSSILEGNFSWTGEKWCLKTEKTVTTKKISIARPQTKMKLPNINKKSEQKLCDLCGSIFKTQDKLSNHKRKVHFNKPVKCPKCSRICASDYYLNRHMKRKHETARDFICSTCGQGFVYRTEMRSHFKNVHNKHLKPKKIFSCKFCEKIYKCPKSVLIHERSVHTGERPARCSVCDSSFYHEDYLREHMRLHTGETPFKCPICGRGYAQRSNMKSHLRIHRVSELDAVTLSKMRPNYLKLLKV